ncbi:MAG: MBL fold metallo-hydrolase [Proteobacteria bacterium]|jgi:glyoxylase-like metal-dependent hydrolase (beta-lactamase superfamily II)|nr:MBL fold metallo-hydrolase [Pseudomonadota bacterium]
MTSRSKVKIQSFFDAETFTVSYVVADEKTSLCAIIDPVLGFDPVSGRSNTIHADQIITYINDQKYQCEWIFETHVHADHLSSAPYLKKKLGGKTAIGRNISLVQKAFGPIFNTEENFIYDGRQFDHLFSDNELFKIGTVEGRVIHTPGHTPACVSYYINGACFIGDTMFMPDYGTARCDFPGGDAEQLYDSITRILSLPDETILYLCHDYAPGGREFKWITTVKEQRENNIHLVGKNKPQYVIARKTRDAELSMPKLMIPSVQVNMRAGHFPPSEENGTSYIKIPINKL